MLESIKCSMGGAYYVRGAWVNADADAPAALAAQGFDAAAVADAPKGTMAYGILTAHNTSGDDQNLKIKFDAMASHDITFVGIIQTARASGLLLNFLVNDGNKATAIKPMITLITPKKEN